MNTLPKNNNTISNTVETVTVTSSVKEQRVHPILPEVPEVPEAHEPEVPEAEPDPDGFRYPPGLWHRSRPVRHHGRHDHHHHNHNHGPDDHSHDHRTHHHGYHFPDTHVRRPVAGGVILDSSLSKILLIQGRESGKWGVPKGGINTWEKEDALSAGLREITEETGLHIKMHVPMAPCVTYRRAKLFLFSFPEEFCQSRLNIQDTHEIKNCQWFSIEDLESIPSTSKTMMLKSLINRIDHIKSKIRNNYDNYRVINNELTVNWHLNILLEEYYRVEVPIKDIVHRLEEKFPQVFFKPEMFHVLSDRSPSTNSSSATLATSEASCTQLEVLRALKRVPSPPIIMSHHHLIALA